MDPVAMLSRPSPPGPPSRLLLVDDDEALLRSVARYVRTFEERWEVVTAPSARAALGLLADSDFDVVISDLHMPSVDGVDFLRRVQQEHPDTVRILLTGGDDPLRARKAVAPAHQFLKKSSSPGRVRRALARARATRWVLADPEMRAMVGGDNTLGSPPQLYLEVTAALAQPNVSVMQIGAIVERDVAMTARILQVVSSAFFALPRPVSDVGEAIGFVGVDTIRALVLQEAFFCAFRSRSRHFDVVALEEHALRTVRLAQRIAAGREDASAAVLAAMTHDVGQLVLASRLPDRFDEAAELAAQRAIPLHEAERRVFGVSHAEVGAFLLGLWGIDDAIVDAVQHHHRRPPGERVELDAALVVHLANLLCHDPEAELPRALASLPEVERRIERWRAAARFGRE
jgi:HD-like signal output (HDOD) protein